MIRVQDYKEFRCGKCGHMERVFATVPEQYWPKECPKCSRGLPDPGEFDYPLLDEAITEALDNYRHDCQRYMDERAETLLDDITNEFNWRRQEKQNDAARNAKRGANEGDQE